jgi:hypothetical protein
LVFFVCYILELLVFTKMSGVQEISMADSHEIKLDTVLRAIKALTKRSVDL